VSEHLSLHLLVCGHAQGELPMRANETACALGEATVRRLVGICMRLCFTGLQLRWPFFVWMPGLILHLFYPITTGRRKLFRALAGQVVM
jgi:hypothetical protein